MPLAIDNLRWIRRGLIVAVCAALLAPAGIAHGQGLGRRQHVWGRFAPRSWRVMRVETDTLGPQGEVMSSSSSESKTVLEDVGDSGVVLRVESTVQVAGKRLDAAPQQVREAFDGKPIERPATVRELGRRVLSIEGRDIECRVEETEVLVGQSKTVTQSWYADDTWPYLLRRDRVTSAVDTGAVIEKSTLEVVSFRTVRRILFRDWNVVELREVREDSRGRTVTLSWTSDSVPGGVVDQVTEELDRSGQTVRRTRAWLVDYASR